MIKVLLFDFSRVLLFSKDSGYVGELNALHDTLQLNTKYKIFEHFELNNELLDIIQKIDNKVKKVIFTSGHIQNEPSIFNLIKSVFDQIISAEEIGVSKKDSGAYKKIAEILQVKSEDILFIDDSVTNIEAAKEVGIKTIQFKSNRQIISDLACF